MPKSRTRKKKKGNRRPAAPLVVESKKDKRPSPKWYVALMFGLMAFGVILILLNYVGVVPGGTSNKYLLSGLGAIAAGFLMTLNFR